MNFAERVLVVFAGQCDAVSWHLVDGRLQFYVDCSDTFGYATADAEEVTPDNIAALEGALADVTPLFDDAFDRVWNATVLFIARIRKTRPIGYHKLPEDLLEAALAVQQ